MIVCVVDTSVICELLAIPGKHSRHESTTDDFAARQAAGHQFIVPLAAVIELGNHIAQVSDGTSRRSAAERFTRFVGDALDGKSPFTATPAPGVEDVRRWLSTFVDDAMRGMSMGDRTVLAVWTEQCGFHPRGRVYIWSFDADLTGWDTATG